MSERNEVVGLRDRKKRATRATLQREALRLFGERGFEATTVQDIVAAAEVSERTFFRYFASKDDLVLGDFIDALPELLAALRARPAGEPPLVAVQAALRTLAPPDGMPRPAALLGNARATARSRVSSRMLEVIADWEEQLAAVLLERDGYEPDTAPDALRLRADVAARASLAALRAALVTYRRVNAGRRDDQIRLVALVAEAFGVLADGCASAAAPPNDARHPRARPQPRTRSRRSSAG